MQFAGSNHMPCSVYHRRWTMGGDQSAAEAADMILLNNDTTVSGDWPSSSANCSCCPRQSVQEDHKSGRCWQNTKRHYCRPFKPECSKGWPHCACSSTHLSICICRAKDDLDTHVSVFESWPDFCFSLDDKKLIMAPFCGVIKCENFIKKKSSRFVLHTLYVCRYC